MKKLLAVFVMVVMVATILPSGGSAEAIEPFVTEPMVTAAGYHTVALKTDGTVWAWGENCVGQLGEERFCQGGFCRLRYVA